MNELSTKLLELEKSLWVTSTRFSKTYMGKILDDDFFEFGRSGRIYSRAQVIESTDNPEEILVQFPLGDFQVKKINNDVLLVTYISTVVYETTEVSNRSSIWCKYGDEWRIKFHQGTPTES